MNNFLALLEFGAFYIEYKNVKFTTINSRGRTRVKITTKSTHFLRAKKKIPILWIELRTNKTQKFTSKHRAIKISKLQGLFPKMWIKKKHNFSKNELFFSRPANWSFRGQIPCANYFIIIIYYEVFLYFFSASIFPKKLYFFVFWSKKIRRHLVKSILLEVVFCKV